MWAVRRRRTLRRRQLNSYQQLVRNRCVEPVPPTWRNSREQCPTVGGRVASRAMPEMPADGRVARGGATACCTRSTRARTWTRTATASATCAASPSASTISQWLGVEGDLARPDHACRRTTTGATTSPTTSTSTRARHARRRRRADRGGGAARHPRDPRPRAEPHERPAPVVRRREVVARLAAPRLVRVGRPEARRFVAEQLGHGVRPAPARVDVRRGERPVLPEPVPAVAARPQLVEPGGARRVRRHPALLVRPRRRRLPHRRRALDHQGRASCATTRPRRRTTTGTSR